MVATRTRRPLGGLAGLAGLADLADLALMGLAATAFGCADPVMVDPPDDCTVLSQNTYVLDVMKHAYLWNSEVPDVDPADYDTPRDILADLRFREVDRWSRVADKVQSDALFKEGKTIGYGFSHMRDRDGKIRVSFVHEDSPAGHAGLVRGDEIVEINRLSIAEIDAGGLWGDMFGPSELGVTVDLQIVEEESAEPRSVRLERDWISIVTVPVTTIVDRGERKVGYLYFSSFVDTAIAELDEAVAGFKQAGIRELVVDLRYNGGGRLKVARHLASLIASDAGRRRQIAYHVQYNDDLAEENEHFKLDRLAHALDLDRVYFITTRRTISASEVVINSVRPYVETYVIGEASGGKPVGMRAFEFCDKILFPITFRMVNVAGETDYFDGLPVDCVAADDLLSQLGSPGETSFAAALAMIDGEGCITSAAADPDAAAIVRPAPTADELPFLTDPLRATIGVW